MSEFVQLQWLDEMEESHEEIINTRNIEKVYMVLPGRTELRMVERERGRWLVREMLYASEGECCTAYKMILKALVED